MGKWFYDTLETAAKNYSMHDFPDILRQWNMNEGNLILTWHSGVDTLPPATVILYNLNPKIFVFKKGVFL